MKKSHEPKFGRPNTRRRRRIPAAILSFLPAFLPAAALGQQQQTQTIPTVTSLNAQYVQGVAPGYTPTSGTGLTLNIASGTAYCSDGVVAYAGGTLAMLPSATNYVYLDASAGCVPATNITGFTVAAIPIAVVNTGPSSITSVTDDRTWFTTGMSSTLDNMGIGTMTPNEKLEVSNGNVRTDTGYFYALGTLIPQMLLNAPGSYFGDVQNDNGGTWSLAYTTTPNLVLGTPVLSWTTTNRVGIGNVTSPTQTLDVNGSGRFRLNTVSFSAAPAFDASLGNTQEITLTGNITSSTLVNASAGEFLYFIICQDATGSRAFTWPPNLHGGMTVGTTPGKCSAQSFVFDGTTAYAVSSGLTNQ